MTNETKSTDRPFSHGISRRKLLSTLALGSTALGTGVIGTAVVSMSGEGHLAKLITGRTPNTDSFHDALISPATAQGVTSVDTYSLSFSGGEGQSSIGVELQIDNLGQVRRVIYSPMQVDGTEERVIRIGWDEGSSLTVAQTLTYIPANLVDPVSRLSNAFGVSSPSPLVFVNGVTSIGVDAPTGLERDLAEFFPSVDGIAPKVITGAVGGVQATILPVLYRAGPEIAFTLTNRITGVVEQLQQGYEGKLFFAGYYVGLHGGTAGWQYIPTSGGVSRDMQLEVPIVVGGEVQYVPLPKVVIARNDDQAAPLSGDAYDGYLLPPGNGVNNNYEFGPARLLPASEFRTNFDAALNSALIGVIPQGGEEADRTFDPMALVTFSDSIPPTTPYVPPATTVTATVTVTETTIDTATMAPTTTANATIAPTTTEGFRAVPTTTTLVSTTAATTLVSTTAATTLVSTTMSDPAIAGALPISGAIKAQGNIGGDVARSLSRRLSSFRTRNRKKSAQRQQVAPRRR